MLIFRRLLIAALALTVSNAVASAQTVIVDNTSGGFSGSVNWQSFSATGQYGTDYAFRTAGFTPLDDVSWTANLLHPGTYDISVWYRNANDRPSNAKYTIEHANGSTVVFIDQRINGSQWVSLGSFDFDAGPAVVRLSNDADFGTTVIADAVRFLGDGSAASEEELRACWLTQYQYLGKSEAQLRAIAQNMRAGNINMVYIAMYAGQQVYWPSKAYQAAGGSWGSSSVDYADYLTRIFHEEGLKVGAWFEYGMALGFSGQAIAVANPDWLARDKDGSAITGENGGFVFLSPGHPDAMNMLVEMCRELAANYDFDDIQVDRFRWGRKTSGREYGYEDATANLYQAQFGSQPPNNINNNNWVNFRIGLVNDAVQACYDAIKDENPNITVSSAPVGSYGFTQHMQIWPDWVEGGYMDLVMPQMYMTSLSAFQNELNIQRSQVPAFNDRVAVGYRANEDNGWTLVRDQMNYARSQGHPHGCLWVYHQYTAQIAIQDELDNLPTVGQPWEALASNPFVSECMEQIVVDNRDGAPRYVESGNWISSAQPDFFRFDSRVAEGGANATVTFGAAIPKSADYEVFVWNTASGNRNPAAEFTVQHATGSSTVTIDQRVDGGQWRSLGVYAFDAGATTPVVELSSAGSGSGVYTSADAMKLTLVGNVKGDGNGDCLVDQADMTDFIDCLLGPDNGPIDSACQSFDFDYDDDVDVADLSAFQTSLAG